MVNITRRTAIAGGLVLAAGCSTGPRFLTYDGPEVTSIVTFKSKRKLYLYHDREVLETYDIDLGFAPVGQKHFQGDGKTPEGQYWISHRNPRSQYHLSLGISYPNAEDVAYARSQGRNPGGDIFIHGTPGLYRRSKDWTAGCIAVSNRQVEVIYSMVKNGTPIFIYA
ncbi:MAG: L,D-transpeptidase family protein [Rhodobacterales bacterium]|nr:L,D-transpeptidase family protein [Rhodobacterales bacterium]